MFCFDDRLFQKNEIKCSTWNIERNKMDKTADLLRKLTDVPFGFCSFAEFSDRLLECRAKQRIPKNASTVICFAFPYKVREQPPKNISRYAAVPDYHSVCGEQLKVIAAALRKNNGTYSFEPFIDNSPIPEVAAASAAGLGVVGKNGLLITEKYGSFVFLGEIVTDMPMKTDSLSDMCENCGMCAAACPVGLDKNRCLSALTQKKGVLGEEEEKAIRKSGCIWGCDICQNVCPHNKNAENTENTDFISGYRNGYKSGEDISGRAFAWRGEKVIKRNAELFAK